MTDKKKKGRSGGSGYRAPRPAAEVPESGMGPKKGKGFLSAILEPRPRTGTAMPKAWNSIGRGLVTVAASPLILLVAFGSVFAMWMMLLALGFQGPIARLASGLVLPPLGTGIIDVQLSSELAGAPRNALSVLAIVPFLLVRSLILSVIIGLVVEALESGVATWVGVVRGLRRVHVVLSVHILGLALVTVSGFLAPLLGPGIGILAFIASLVVGVYLFVFAPVIAVRQGLSMPDCLKRGWRTARVAGMGNLGMATMYVIPVVAILVGGSAPRWSVSLLGVNPPYTGWIFILGVAFLQVGYIAAFAFRWMSVEAEAPTAERAPPPPARKRGR